MPPELLRFVLHVRELRLCLEGALRGDGLVFFRALKLVALLLVLVLKVCAGGLDVVELLLDVHLLQLGHLERLILLLLVSLQGKVLLLQRLPVATSLTGSVRHLPHGRRHLLVVPHGLVILAFVHLCSLLPLLHLLYWVVCGQQLLQPAFALRNLCFAPAEVDQEPLILTVELLAFLVPLLLAHLQLLLGEVQLVGGLGTLPLNHGELLVQVHPAFLQIQELLLSHFVFLFHAGRLRLKVCCLALGVLRLLVEPCHVLRLLQQRGRGILQLAPQVRDLLLFAVPEVIHLRLHLTHLFQETGSLIGPFRRLLLT
mmetsp:Transcript_61922/g.164561  ORF Transcript_61922/g.164561 Transcript_61922/m.164561 type:complete len:313 (+) Transcript_61922:351-1289(+)